MDHAEASAMSKGDRIEVFRSGQWEPGIIRGTASGGDPAVWVQLDGQAAETKIYTGLQFKADAWDLMFKNRKFRRAGLV